MSDTPTQREMELNMIPGGKILVELKEKIDNKKMNVEKKMAKIMRLVTKGS
jgi:hypothetical protein